MVTRYRSTWRQADLMEFALSHTVRYRDPLNKKRFAIPYKDAQKAADKMAQLKRDGVKEIEITKDILRGKFKEAVDCDDDYRAKKKAIQDIQNDPKQNAIVGRQKILQRKDKLDKDYQDCKAKNEELEENLRYSVKFAYKKGGKIANSFYKDKAEAEKFVKSVIAKGGKAIMTTEEADLTKGQIKKVHKLADKMPADDFKDRYGKDGDSVRYATATNMIKKKEGITEAMSPAQVKKLRDSWAEIKLMSPEKVKTLKNFLDKYSTDTLMQLSQAGINFVSNMARSVASRRKVGDMKHAGSQKTYPKLREQVQKSDSERMASMRVSQMRLQDKLKNLDVGDPKDKTPIEITKNDIENIQMKMDQLKKKNMRKESKEHPAKALYEKIAGLQKKADKSGMPYSILKQVYNRGMAAWKGGHRPGTTPQQWAFARVNSFVTKSSGTWGGADKDLAKKVRGKK